MEPRRRNNQICDCHLEGDSHFLNLRLTTLVSNFVSGVEANLGWQYIRKRNFSRLPIKAPENKELAEKLANQSEPTREVGNARAREYPDLRDQVGAIMAEFQRRQDAGEKLSPELSNILAKIAETKNKLPKKNTELGI